MELDAEEINFIDRILAERVGTPAYPSFPGPG